jgi:hypothetical protein
MFQEFYHWYLAPWLRVDRKLFNIVVLVATLPGLFLGIGSMAGFLSPLAGMMTLGQHLNGAADAGNLSSLSDTLNHMQTISTQVEGTGQAIGGKHWQGWLNLLIMASLTPLMLGRARDIGIRKAWLPATLAQSSLATDFLKLLGLASPLGWLTGILSFGVVMWLCVKPSKPREPKFPPDANNQTPNPYI